MAASSVLTPIGPLLSLVGGLVATMFGGGMGASHLTIAELGQVVLEQLHAFEMLKYTKLTFPSISDAVLVPFIQTLSATATKLQEARNTGAGVKNILHSLEKALPNIRQTMQGVVIEMLKAYRLAAGSRDNGPRANLGHSRNFARGHCCPRCHQSRSHWVDATFNVQNIRMWNLALESRSNIRGDYNKLRGMLVGFQALASQLAAVEVLLDSIVHTAEVTSYGKHFAEKTTVDRLLIANSLQPVHQRSIMITAQNIQERCDSTFDNFVDKQSADEIRGTCGVAPIPRKCIDAVCVSRACQYAMQSPEWEV